MSDDTFALRDEMHRFEQELSFAISKNIQPDGLQSGQNSNVPTQGVTSLNKPMTKPLFTQFIPNQLVKKGVAPSTTTHLQTLQPPPGFRPPPRPQYLSPHQLMPGQQHMLYNVSPHMHALPPPTQPLMMPSMGHAHLRGNLNIAFSNIINQSNAMSPSMNQHLATNTNQTSNELHGQNLSNVYVAAPSIKYEKLPLPTINKSNIPPALQHLIKPDDNKLPLATNTASLQPAANNLTFNKDIKTVPPQSEGFKLGTTLITAIDKSINLEKGKDKDKKKKKKEQEDLSIPISKPRPKKSKIIFRHAAGSSWVDGSLLDWDPNDYRIFCGDLGNEVSDDVLTRAFNRYPSFQRARVIRDKRNNKTKGFGFVSFKDPLDYAKAMKEMNGRYVGSRPIKLRKSTWNERGLDAVKKKSKEKQKLINQIKALDQ